MIGATSKGRSGPGIAFAPGHDVALYAKVFRAHGRIHIPAFLSAESALALHEAISTRTAWAETVVQDSGARDFSAEELALMPDEKREMLDRVVLNEAREKYVGRYRTCRLSQDGESFVGGPEVLGDLTDFLNGPDFLDFIRTITGDEAIRLADAQATCFDPGDFLHGHTDVHVQKKRRCAYVLNLTPRWRVEWGGLLGFVDEAGHVSEAFTPAWNALNLLRVDQLHYVSAVAPFAGARRYSVTGWLREA